MAALKIARGSRLQTSVISWKKRVGKTQKP